MTIEIPDWARLGKPVLIKDVTRIRGDNPNEWYKETIIGFGYDGVFHKAPNCPTYFTKFDQWNKTIKE